MVRELVTDPQSFFRGKAQDRSVVLELVIVLAVGGIGTVGSYLFVQKVFELADTGGFSAFQSFGLAITPLAGAVVFWIGSAAATHFVAGLYNGRGPIRRLLKLTAWSLVPLAVGNAVRSAVIYLTYNDMGPEDVDFGFAGGFDAQAQIVREAANNDTLTIVAMLVLILSVVATWHLMSYAVATAKQIDVSDARKVAAVPCGLFVILLLRTLLTAVGVL